MSDRKQDGRRIAGRYHLQEPIGKGGMGIVWRAHDELLDRTVAVKEVRYAAALGDEVQLLNRRTMREARAAARFEHPNVIVVHDVIEEDGRPWIVMQLVQSRSLGAVIKQDGPLSPARVAEIGLAVLDALHRAHEAGVLHRDVKPENVLLADDGRVVLTDFGIATLETETQLTVTGLAGTPAFIAPERLKGLPARRESDLWSLGATLYTAVEGRSPHERGMALATMHAVLTDEPDPAPHAGPLAPVIDGLLVKEPVQRLTYEETTRLLRRISQSGAQPLPVPRADPPTRMQPAIEDDMPTDPDLAAPPPARPAPFAETGARFPEPGARRPWNDARHPESRPRHEEDDSRYPRDHARQESDSRYPHDDARQEGDGRYQEGRGRREGDRYPESRGRQEGGARYPESRGHRPESESLFAEAADRFGPATAGPETGDPTREGGSGRRQAVPVVVAVVAVVLIAAVGGYLGLRSTSEETPQEQQTAAASTDATSGPSGSPAQPSSEPPSATPDGSPSPTPTEAEEKAESPALPSGWKLHKDKKLDFTIGLPKGWEEFKRAGSQVFFRGPGAGSNAFVSVDRAANPGSDPYKDWKKQEKTARYGFGGYELIGIKKVDFQKAAADWDFTWRTNTGLTRVRNRGFITDNGRGYAIYWHNLNSRWKKDYHFFETFCATFKPDQ